jgi:hypothetical protein
MEMGSDKFKNKNKLINNILNKNGRTCKLGRDKFLLSHE